MTTSSKHSTVGVVIAALNEESTVAAIVRGARQYAAIVVVVDDGSSDRTALEAKEAGAQVISHKESCGYDRSIEDGFREVANQKADIIVTIDADGEHDPHDIRELVGLITTDKADLVVGRRPRIPRLIERVFAFYTRIRFGIEDPLCGFKAYKREIYEAVGHFDTLQSVGTQLMIEAVHGGFRVKSLPIRAFPRKAGRSRFFFHQAKGNYRIIKALAKVIVFVR